MQSKISFYARKSTEKQAKNDLPQEELMNAILDGYLTRYFSEMHSRAIKRGLEAKRKRMRS